MKKSSSKSRHHHPPGLMEALGIYFTDNLKGQQHRHLETFYHGHLHDHMSGLLYEVMVGCDEWGLNLIRKAASKVQAGMQQFGIYHCTWHQAWSELALCKWNSRACYPLYHLAIELHKFRVIHSSPSSYIWSWVNMVSSFVWSRQETGCSCDVQNLHAQLQCPLQPTYQIFFPVALCTKSGPWPPLAAFVARRSSNCEESLNSR